MVQHVAMESYRSNRFLSILRIGRLDTFQPAPYRQRP